ncbi:MAG: 3-dehydroquinate synthase family protein [Actinomycetes bacterium]
MTTIHVPLSERSYDVEVGAGVREHLASVIAKLAPDAKLAAMVTQDALIALPWFSSIDPGIASIQLSIPEGEDAKSLETIGILASRLAQAGFSRRDIVVAVGGGMVSDVAGFLAASFHRGVNYITVATTLLAQVDAAIGGKTGVNIPEGKNLIGAFHQPLAVLCDSSVLETLDAPALRCGLGEVAKYVLLAGEQGPSLLELSRDEQIAACAKMKADVVAGDEREAGKRALLNYGHTFAHALEAEGLLQRSQGARSVVGDLQHGEAVAIGLAAASRLAMHLGRIDDGAVRWADEVLTRLGLPSQLPEGLSASELLAHMAKDKKAHHDLTFVLDGPRGIEVVEAVDAEAVRSTLIAMGARS